VGQIQRLWYPPRAPAKSNLGYPTGPAYHLIGFDTPTFTPIFVAARLPGWTAHIAEQLAANSLIRPLASYTGPFLGAVTLGRHGRDGLRHGVAPIDTKV
jgi:hypothetical protein